MKEYQKPELELVTLSVMETITDSNMNGDDFDGNQGYESSMW